MAVPADRVLRMLCRRASTCCACLHIALAFGPSAHTRAAMTHTVRPQLSCALSTPAPLLQGGAGLTLPCRLCSWETSTVALHLIAATFYQGPPPRFLMGRCRLEPRAQLRLQAQSQNEGQGKSNLAMLHTCETWPLGPPCAAGLQPPWPDSAQMSGTASAAASARSSCGPLRPAAPAHPRSFSSMLAVLIHIPALACLGVAGSGPTYLTSA